MEVFAAVSGDIMGDSTSLEAVEGLRVRLTGVETGDERYGLVEQVEGESLCVRFFPGDQVEVDADYRAMVYHGPGEISFVAKVKAFREGKAQLRLESEVTMRESRTEYRMPAMRVAAVLRTQDQAIDAWMVDMSEGGLALDSAVVVPAGQAVEMDIALPDGPLRLLGEVRNCTMRADKEGYRVGIRLKACAGATAVRWSHLLKRLAALMSA